MPWVLVAFHVLVNRSPVTDLIGIVAGHLYYFVQEVLPAAESPLRGKRLLQTPQFMFVAGVVEGGCKLGALVGSLFAFAC